MTCYSTIITVADAADVEAWYAVAMPSMPLTGTMVLFSGGNGGKFFDEGFVQKFLDQGKRVIQVKWRKAWEDTLLPVKNMLKGGARPATILQLLFEVEHGSNTGLAFGTLGHSGGSAQVAYSLAHYGRASILDCAMLSSGPPFGNLKRGCKYPDLGAKEVCPDGQYGCNQQFENYEKGPYVSIEC